MPFDINTATEVETPAKTGGFDIGSARVLSSSDEQKETIFREDTGSVLSAPSGLSGDQVSFLDDIQNQKQEPQEFFGFNKIFDRTIEIAQIPFKGSTATAIHLGATGEAGARLKVADAIRQGLTEDTDALRRRSLSGEKLTDEEYRVLNRDLAQGNMLFGYLFQSPEDRVRNKVKRAVKKGDLEKIAKFEARAAELEQSVGKLRQSADELIQKHVARPTEDESTLAERILYDVSGAITTAGASIGLFAVTKNPIASGSLFFELQSSDVYLEARDAEDGVEKAKATANLAGAVEAGLEMIGTSYFFKIAENSKGATKHIKRMVEEGLQEFFQQTGEEVITQGSGIREQDIQGGLERIGYAAFLGSLAGGAISVGIDTVIKQETSQTDIPPELIKSVLDKVEAEGDVVFSAVMEDLSNGAAPLSDQVAPQNPDQAMKIINDFSQGKDIDLSELSQEDQDVIKKASAKNLKIPVEQVVTNQNAINEALFEENTGIIDATLEGTQDALGTVGLGLERVLTPISTRIKNINEKLFFKIREFEFNTKTKIQQDEQAALPFFQKYKKLNKKTQKVLDLALKNGDTQTINEIGRAYGISREINDVRNLLDDLFKRAREAGIDVAYRSDFFPRTIRDFEGLMEHLRDTKEWTLFDTAFKNQEKKLERSLTDDEKAHIINKLLRGFTVADVTLSKSGRFKERTIEKINSEINKFYNTTDQSLLGYLVVANEAIETSKLFGKGQPLDGGPEQTTDSIGAFVNNLVDNKEITTAQATQLKSILGARFNSGKIGPIAGVFRDLSYIDTMGSPLNAITQIGDLATSLYNAGLINTLTTLPSSVTGIGNKITLKDLAIEKIAQEFQEGSITSELVTGVFKATQLERIDRIGKRTLVNSAFKKYVKLAKKPNKEFLAKMDLMFEGEAAQVIEELKNKQVTDNTKLLVFNDLLDFQPVAKSEMPEYYLRSGNLRILYMLKTFTLRQLDIYRREVSANLSKAWSEGDPKLAVKAMGNLVRLAGFWIAMGATADFLKDFIRSLFGGDEMEEPQDYLLENIWKAFGFSKYQADQVGRLGPYDVMEQTILPPKKLIRNIFRDFKKANSDKGLLAEDAQSIRSIPVGGELYYFWFGGGDDGGGNSKGNSTVFNP